MPRKAFFPNPQNKPKGWSPVTRAGNTVFVSGQVGVDASGKVVGVGDCRAQAEQCFKNIEAALRAAGATLNDVTKITCFLVNAEDYQAYNAVRQQVFSGEGPASSTVIIKALVNPQYLIEVEAVAVV